MFFTPMTYAERLRRTRNVFWAGVAGACTTLAGAILLLIPTGYYFWALLGLAVAVVLCWLFLGRAVHSDYQEVKLAVGASRHTLSGILRSQASYVGRGQFYEGQADEASKDDPDAIEQEAARRARWAWALRHPFGVRNRGL
jgi:hypothetical protein